MVWQVEDPGTHTVRLTKGELIALPSVPWSTTRGATLAAGALAVGSVTGGLVETVVVVLPRGAVLAPPPPPPPPPHAASTARSAAAPQRARKTCNWRMVTSS